MGGSRSDRGTGAEENGPLGGQGGFVSKRGSKPATGAIGGEPITGKPIGGNSIVGDPIGGDPDSATDSDDFEVFVPHDGMGPVDVGPFATEPALRHFLVGSDGNGVRLDKYLAIQMPEVSRSRLQRWIEDDAVLLNGAIARSRASVFAGDRVDVQESAPPASFAFGPEAIPLSVVWEDETIIVINKPAGLVVHPGAGNWSGTLLNGLLAYDPALAQVPRAGIVHRLDAGTSGLMVVARTVAAQLDLVRQLQARTVGREYWALVSGAFAPSASIDSALGRDPRNPLRFRVSTALTARPARTYVRRLAQWPVARPGSAGGGNVSWLACRLDTGRTHQIRVHLESIGHPLLGDPVYRKHLPAELLALALPDHILDHQALHACRLALVHPVSQEVLSWSQPPPDDLRRLLLHLGARKDQLRPPPRGYFDEPAGGQRHGS
jgi:23S rRNA pseudouridine1911/1915/1917 synthase